MSMFNKPTSPNMKPKKLDAKKKIEKATKPPVTKKKTAYKKSVPKVVALKGKGYINGQA